MQPQAHSISTSEPLSIAHAIKMQPLHRSSASALDCSITHAAASAAGHNQQAAAGDTQQAGCQHDWSSVTRRVMSGAHQPERTAYAVRAGM